MGLIEIPQEGAEKQKGQKVGKGNLLTLIRRKLSLKEISRDEKVVGNTCIKMVRYLTDKTPLSLDEIESLLEGMQRSVISIQKKKKTLLEKKRKR